MRCQIWMFILFGTALLAGCTQPYQQPLIYAADKSSSVYADATDFDGVDSLLSQETPSRIFWTHGICRHNVTWAIDRLEQLATRLAPDGTATAAMTAIDPIEGSGGAYVVKAYVSVPGKGRVDIDFLIWSNIIEPYRSYIAMSTNTDLQRASLNRDLVDVLMNECLVDAVVYSGSNGNAIRLAASVALCRFMGGTSDGNACTFDAAPMPKTAFISESIGSKILIDALDHLWEQPGAAEADRTISQSRLGQRMTQVSTVYFLANQVPILDTANINPRDMAHSSSGSLGILSKMLSVRRGRNLPDLTIVAFTDPNDLLSYVLPVAGPEGTRTINVVVSNDWTYLGYVEHPLNAHCGYRFNPAVVELSTHGYRAGAEIRKFGLSTLGDDCAGS